MDEDLFFIFCLGFFLFSAYLCMHENRRNQAHRDRRDDLAYERMLSERREFGYKNVEDSLKSKRRTVLFRFK